MAIYQYSNIAQSACLILVISNSIIVGNTEEYSFRNKKIDN